MNGVATPIYFGPAARPLAGWLHLPAATTGPHPVALVICNPFGYEALCTHRMLRRLANQAAEAGIPTLRFDYDGTGDSAGDDLDPDRLSCWIASIREAVDTLRLRVRPMRVCLLGMRLGTLLAGLALSEGVAADALIAVSPVVEGRKYVRELRAFKAAVTDQGPADGPELQSGGFSLTPETVAALSGVTLLKSAPVRTLIIDRADLPAAGKWAEQLRAAGAEIEYGKSDELANALINPHDSAVPQRVLDETVAWLQALPAPPPAPVVSQLSPEMQQRAVMVTQSGQTIEECAVQMRPDGSLFGILTRPTHRPVQKAILLLNAGATYHIGPNRMYVDFARRWALEGVAVLRFDLSGIGDSRAHEGADDNVVYSQHAMDDIAQANRYATRELGVQDIALVGLCSGAYHALKAGVAGQPATRLVMINPLTFFWRDGMSLGSDLSPHQVAGDATTYRKHALQLSRWLKVFSGKVDVKRVAQVFALQLHARLSSLGADIARLLRIPLREDLGAELRSVAQRNTSMTFVFASGEPGMALLRMQAGSSLRQVRRSLDIHEIANANHTFTSRQARLELESVLRRKLL